MKISPVVGTPTIPQPSSTGLSPEKIQRLKNMAAGQSPATHEDKVEIAQKVPPTNTVIKMKTNQTPEQPAAPQEVAAELETKPENAVSDTDVQTKPVPEAIQQVSPQVAAFAKQKRALQVKERELADREKALSEKAEGHTVDTLKQRAKSGKALSVLQDLGITYDMLTNELTSNISAPDFTTAKEEILKAVDERLAGKDVAQEQAVFDHMKRNVDKMATTEEYPFIRTAQAQDKVMELIKRTWKESGEVLDEEEALQLIESELKEDAKAYAKLLQPEPTTPAAGELPPKQQGIRTLTNKDSARPGMSRRQRAIAAALGQK